MLAKVLNIKGSGSKADPGEIVWTPDSWTLGKRPRMLEENPAASAVLWWL